MSTNPETGRFPAVSDGQAPAHRPVARHTDSAEHEGPISFDWRKNVGLFVATVASVFFVGSFWTGREGMTFLQQLASGWKFAVPLMTILVCHEFGHYIAARIHKVPASLPYFLPLPIFNPFGTLGAVIVMPERIRSRKALLDIGAAGPLAGMAVAVPIMLYGLSLSELGPRNAENYIQEGQSILYWAMKSAVFGFIPPDKDVFLHPTALAAWAGFFVTFLNLLPVGQLDGGHVAYALLGERQNRIARHVMYAPLALLAYNFVVHVVPIFVRAARDGSEALSAGSTTMVSSTLMWVFAYVMLRLMRRWVGIAHPPVDEHSMGPIRKGIAIFTLTLFVLLFMPSPWVAY